MARRWCSVFFSSRRRHTRLQGDWSSDVCSSDLDRLERVCVHDFDVIRGGQRLRLQHFAQDCLQMQRVARARAQLVSGSLQSAMEHGRSEERRVGKEGRSRWSPYHLKKKMMKLGT